MFKVKTVLVVGAGASKEAGLPVGSELRDRIYGQVDIVDEGGFPNDRPIAKFLQATLGPSIQSEPYQDALSGALTIKRGLELSYSIDNFLEAHYSNKSLVDIGKMAILEAIANAENSSLLQLIKDSVNGRISLNFRKCSITWYVEFFRVLVENVSKSDLDTLFDNLEIISFNYDRCIEHYLAHALAVYYSIEINESYNLIRTRLKIWHPYGTIGQLPWQALGIGTEIEFGGNQQSRPHIYYTQMRERAINISTFTEQKLEKTMRDTYRNSLYNADTIVFLGFAYHEMNMKLLYDDDGSKAQASMLIGTTMGLSDNDVEIVKNEMNHFLYKDDCKVKMDNITCFELFSQYRRSLMRSA